MRYLTSCDKADVESIFTPLSISKCPLKTQKCSSKLQKYYRNAFETINRKAFVYDLKVELKIPVLDLK